MRTDFFNEAIVTALLAASSPGGASPGPEDAEENLGRADVLRERLAALLERADRAAVQAGIPKNAVEAADFAVCAFIDEALLSSAAWPGRADWLAKPLQFLRHGTATAGEDFYRILDSLLEEAENNAMPLPLAEDAGIRPAPEEDEARDPRRAVLEIFALCLAQGFAGMFYGDASAVRDRLEKIGRLVPAVARRANPFFVPAEKKKERRPLRTVADLFRRFDPLDWLLWLIPPALTAFFYWVCQTRLDELLEPFLQGSALS